MSQVPPIQMVDVGGSAWKVGDTVEARTKTGWADAVITAVNEGNTYDVLFSAKKSVGNKWKFKNIRVPEVDGIQDGGAEMTQFEEDKLYVKKFHVIVATSLQDPTPGRTIVRWNQECFSPGDGPNLNYSRKHCHGRYTYVEMETTTDPAQAATGAKLTMSQGNINAMGGDFAKGTGGAYRYIETVYGGKSKIRADNVGLWRSPNGANGGDKDRWSYWTIDLNKGRSGDYLYLVWNCYEANSAVQLQPAEDGHTVVFNCPVSDRKRRDVWMTNHGYHKAYILVNCGYPYLDGVWSDRGTTQELHPHYYKHKSGLDSAYTADQVHWEHYCYAWWVGSEKCGFENGNKNCFHSIGLDHPLDKVTWFTYKPPDAVGFEGYTATPVWKPYTRQIAERLRTACVERFNLTPGAPALPEFETEAEHTSALGMMEYMRWKLRQDYNTLVKSSRVIADRLLDACTDLRVPKENLEKYHNFEQWERYKMELQLREADMSKDKAVALLNDIDTCTVFAQERWVDIIKACDAGESYVTGDYVRERVVGKLKEGLTADNVQSTWKFMTHSVLGLPFWKQEKYAKVLITQVKEQSAVLDARANDLFKAILEGSGGAKLESFPGQKIFRAKRQTFVDNIMSGSMMDALSSIFDGESDEWVFVNPAGSSSDVEQYNFKSDLDHTVNVTLIRALSKAGEVRFHSAVRALLKDELAPYANNKSKILGYYRGPVKSVERMANKVEDYISEDFPAASCIIDPIRATICFNTAAEVLAAFEKILKCETTGSLALVRYKNKFTGSHSFRNIMVNLAFKTKKFEVVGELQITTAACLELKKVQHKFYAIERVYDAEEDVVKAHKNLVADVCD